MNLKNVKPISVNRDQKSQIGSRNRDTNDDGLIHLTSLETKYGQKAFNTLNKSADNISSSSEQIYEQSLSGINSKSIINLQAYFDD